MDKQVKYSVWVGGSEVNSFLLTTEEAEEIAEVWKRKGYDDVTITVYETETMKQARAESE